MDRTLTYISCLAAMALALGSCRKQPLPNGGEPHAIDFSAVAQAPVSKASYDTGFDLLYDSGIRKEGQKIAVYGTYTSGTAQVPIFRERKQVLTYEGGDTQAGQDKDQWIYKDINGNQYWAYWIPNTTYQFRAVYPYLPALEESSVQNEPYIRPISTAERIIVHYKTGVDGAPHNFDLCVAHSERTTSGLDAYNPVPLKFSHALSALTVKVKYNDNVSADLSDKLTSCYFTDMIQAASMFYPKDPAKPDEIDWSEAASVNTDDKLYSWESSTGLEFTNTKEASVYDGRYIFVIPQSIPAGQAQFHFTTASGNDVVSRCYLPAITWEPGKIYNYTFKITDAGVDVVVTIKPWEVINSDISIIVGKDDEK